MARLLNEANKLDSTILGEGIEVDEKFEDVSFDQMIRAIHVIQQEIGITGTTSIEAAGTIEGSVNSMKAAWTNLSVEIAKDNGNVDSLIDYFVKSVETAANNIIPRISVIMSNIGSLIEKVTPIITKKIPEIVREILPTLLNSAGTIVSSLSKAIIESAPAIMDVGVSILAAIAKGFSSDRAAGDSMIAKLLKEFNQRLPAILRFTKKILKNVARMIISDLPAISEEIFNGLKIILKNIGLGNFTWIIDDIKAVFGKIKDYINKIDFNKIKTSLSDFWDKVSPVIDNLKEALGWLWDNVLEPIGLWVVNEALPAGIDLVSGAIEAFSGVLEIFKPVGEWLWDNFLKPLGEWAGVIAVDGIEALADALSKLGENLEGVDWSEFDVFGTDEETGKSYWELGAGDISNSLEEAGNSIDEFFDMSDFGSKWNDFWQGVGAVVYDGVEWIKKRFADWKFGIKSIKSDWNDFKQQWHLGTEAIKGDIRDYQTQWELGVDSIIDGVVSIKEWINGLGENISDFVNSVENWGADLIDNFISGAKEKWDEWTDTWGEFIDFIVEHMHFSVPEKGPLKDQDEWGGDFVDNFINGIKSRQNALAATVSDTADILNNNFTPELTADINSSFVPLEIPELENITANIKGIFEDMDIPEFTARINGIVTPSRIPEMDSIIRRSYSAYSGTNVGIERSNVTIPNVSFNFAGDLSNKSEYELRELAQRLAVYINEELGIIERRENRAAGGTGWI